MAELLFRLASSGLPLPQPTKALGRLEACLAATAVGDKLQLARAADLLALLRLLLQRGVHGKEGLAGDCLRALIALGAASASLLAIRDLAGSQQEGNAALEDLLGPSRPVWAALGAAAAEAAASGPEAVATAVEEAGYWAPDAGCSPSQALLALARGIGAVRGDPALFAAAARLAADPAVLTLAVVRSTDVGAPREDQEEEEGAATSASFEAPSPAEGDRLALQKFLVHRGIQPQLAGALAGYTAGSAAELPAWALLLAFLRRSGQAARVRRWVSSALGDAQWLLNALLDRLAPLLPLQETGSAVAAAPSLAEMLASGGAAAVVRSDEPAVQALFRAALSALPSSCRSWYHGLRDKGLSAAIERYTSARESPAIIREQLSGTLPSGVCLAPALFFCDRKSASQASRRRSRPCRGRTARRTRATSRCRSEPPWPPGR